MKRFSTPILLIISFLIAEGALYLIFLTMDLSGNDSKTIWLKYAGILLCLIVSMLSREKLIPLALAFTATADWFLLVQNDHLLLGVALFLCVQALYALHLRRAGTSYAPVLRIGVALALILTVTLLDMASPLNLLAMIYFSQLVSNMILAWSLPASKLFALGLTLFIGCDLCVGLVNAVPLPSGIYDLVFVGMWFFYLPSQVLIALSVLFQKEVSHETQ